MVDMFRFPRFEVLASVSVRIPVFERVWRWAVWLHRYVRRFKWTCCFCQKELTTHFRPVPRFQGKCTRTLNAPIWLIDGHSLTRNKAVLPRAPLFTAFYTCSNCTEYSPRWEACSWTASQGISCVLYNPKVRYRIHKWQPTVLILSQINWVRTSAFHFLRNHNALNCRQDSLTYKNSCR